MSDSAASRRVGGGNATPALQAVGRRADRSRWVVRRAGRALAALAFLSPVSFSNAGEAPLPGAIREIPPGTRIEQHEVQQAIQAELWGWGADAATELAVPRFDAQGGNRELVEMRFSYSFRADWTAHWLESSYDVPTYATVRVWIGQDFSPFTDEILHIPPGEGSLSSYGGLRPPFAPAASQPLLVAWSVGYEFDEGGDFVPDFPNAVVVEDATPFIGPDGAVFVLRWFADEPEMTSQLAGLPPPPDAIYTPELLGAELGGASMRFTVHYVYRVHDAVFADGFDGSLP
jgi:hypothetical protein